MSDRLTLRSFRQVSPGRQPSHTELPPLKRASGLAGPRPVHQPDTVGSADPPMKSLLVLD